MNLYVSNLAYTVTDDELRSEFAAYGNVASARVVMDRETGRSRGFGFVDMPTDAEAMRAMESLQGTNVAGRAMRIVEARPKEDRPSSPRPSGGYGGGGGAGRPTGGGPPRENYPDYNDRSGPPGKKQDRGGKGSRRDSWDRGKRSGGFDDGY